MRTALPPDSRDVRRQPRVSRALPALLTVLMTFLVLVPAALVPAPAYGADSVTLSYTVTRKDTGATVRPEDVAPGTDVVFTYTLTNTSGNYLSWSSENDPVQNTGCSPLTFKSQTNGNYNPQNDSARYALFGRRGANLVLTCTKTMQAGDKGTITVGTASTNKAGYTIVYPAAQDWTGPAPSKDLALTKDLLTPSTVHVGDQVSYRLTVTNKGAATATGWTITDTLPSGLTSPKVPADSGCTVSGSRITCSYTGQSLSTGQTMSVDVSGTAASEAQRVVNTATVAMDGDGTPSNDTASADAVTIKGWNAPVVTVAADRDAGANGEKRYEVDEAVTYTYTIPNTTPYDFAWDTAPLTDGVCSPLTPATGFVASGNGYVLPAGVTGTFTCQTSFDAPQLVRNQVTIASGRLMNTADGTVFPTGTGPVDNVRVGDNPDEYDYTVPITNTYGSGGTTYGSKYDWVSLTKTADDYIVTPGTDVTYTFKIANVEGATSGSVDRLYVDRMIDKTEDGRTQCDPQYVSGMLTDESGKRYVPKGGTAVYTCRAEAPDGGGNHKVTDIAEITVNDGHGHYSAAGASATVRTYAKSTDAAGPGGVASCNVIDFTTTSRTPNAGTYGSWDPSSGAFSRIASLPSTVGHAYAWNGTDLGPATKTSAQATSAFDPAYVYYMAMGWKSGVGGGPAGLYRVNKLTGAADEVIGVNTRTEYLKWDNTDSYSTPFSDDWRASKSYRLTFGPDGTLWSWADNGTLYSLAVDPATMLPDPHAHWVDRGSIAMPDNYGFGDLAFDGNGNLWLMAAPQATNDAGESYLFKITESALASAKVGSATKPVSVGTIASPNSNKRGFYGLAFGPDGALYASYDLHNNEGDRTTRSQIYKLTDFSSATGGKVGTQLVADSALLLGVQDLSSCAFPEPTVEAEKHVAESTIPADGHLHYAITVRNTGALDATDVTLGDVLPDDVTYVAGSTERDGRSVPDVKGGFPYAAGGSLGTIPVGGETTVTFAVQTEADRTDPVCNQATISFDGTTIVSDDPGTSAVDDPACARPKAPSLNATKTPYDPDGKGALSGPVDGVYTVAYQITVSNDTDEDATFPGLTDHPYVRAAKVAKVTWQDADDASATQHAVSQIEGTEGYYPVSSATADAPITVSAHGSRTYVVRVSLTMPDGVNATSVGECQSKQDGAYPGGLANHVSLTGGETTYDDNDACVDPPSPVRVKIVKHGTNCDADQPECTLTGAVFDLYDKDPGKGGVTPVADGLTADGATSTSSVLAPGKRYWVVERRAPEGHQLLAEPFSFTATEAGVTISSGGGLVTRDETDRSGLTIKVLDPTRPALPYAGGRGYLPAVAVAAMLFSTAGLWYVLSRRKTARA